MTNTSSVDANNLIYSVPAPGSTGNYTGVTITPNAGIGSQSGACTNIPAGKSCTFTAIIGAYAKPGSFTVTATPNGNSSQSTKAAQSSKSLQAGSISVTANLGLVDVPNTQNKYYILPNDQTITANTTGDTNVMVSVWIKQASENLDSIQLVDDVGNPLNAKLLTSSPVYAQNSVFTYSILVPHGKSIQHIQAFSNVCKELNNGNNNNTACSNDADVNLAPQGNGVLSIQPTYVNMSESYSTQVITLTNTGNGTVSNIVYPNWAILGQGQFATSENNCINFAKLDAGQSCTMTLNYRAESSSSAITPIFTYDDDNNTATATKNTSITVSYSGITPGPDPVAPWSILTLSPDSISLTPANSVRVITLTNTPGGSTNGAEITRLVLPTLNAPLEFESTNCTSTLAIGASCLYTVKYSIASSAGAETVTFNYNNGTEAANSSEAIDWSIKSKYLLMVGGGVSGEGIMSKCTISETNTLIDCANTINIPLSTGGGFDGMTFEIVDGAYKLFMANPAQYGTVYMCDYDIVTGDVSSCNLVSPDATITGNPETPRSIVFHTDNNGNRYAYIVSISASSQQKARNGIYKCDISKTGEITNCAQNIALPNMISSNILFNDTVNGTKVYYAYHSGWSAGQSGIDVCNVDANGDISDCISANLSIPSFSYYFPRWLEFKSFNGVKYMYYNDDATGGFYQCTINQDASLGTCAVLSGFDTNNMWQHLQYAFNSVGQNTALFTASDYKPPSSSWQKVVFDFSVTNNGTALLEESAINKDFFTGYGGNGINSVIVSP